MTEIKQIFRGFCIIFSENRTNTVNFPLTHGVLFH